MVAGPPDALGPNPYTAKQQRRQDRLERRASSRRRLFTRLRFDVEFQTHPFSLWGGKVYSLAGPLLHFTVCLPVFRNLTLSCPHAKQEFYHSAAAPALTVTFWKHVTHLFSYTHSQRAHHPRINHASSLTVTDVDGVYMSCWASEFWVDNGMN